MLRLAAESDQGEEPESESDGELMRELRKALGSLDQGELAASDERVLGNFVDDRKGQVSAFEDEFSKQLDAVQDNIESQIEDKMQSVQSDFLSRIDAAVDDLRRSDEVAAAKQKAAEAIGAVDGLDPAELPEDALIVIAGATTPLGGQLLRALGAKSSWRLRAIVPEGKKLDAPDEVEQVPYAPFAPTALGKSLAQASAVVIVSAAAGGAGGIEPEAVPKMVKALDPNVRRVVMLSVHGVERTDKLPFNMANLFGQLDKQRAAEQEVVLHARKHCPGFSIVRLGKLSEVTSASASVVPRCELEAGDALGGELGLDVAASTIAQALGRQEAVNASFSVGPLVAASDGLPPIASDEAYWEDQWLKLVGPEVYRRPLSSLPVEEMATWLREWARRFLRPGQQLTTPVAVQDVNDGVLLRFLTRASGYADFDADESANDDAWAAAAKSTAGEPDGALLLVAEASPVARVRVTRAEMAEGVQVKEMSEEAVLTKLDRDLSALEKERRNSK